MFVNGENIILLHMCINICIYFWKFFFVLKRWCWAKVNLKKQKNKIRVPTYRCVSCLKMCCSFKQNIKIAVAMVRSYAEFKIAQCIYENIWLLNKYKFMICMWLLANKIPLDVSTCFYSSAYEMKQVFQQNHVQFL